MPLDVDNNRIVEVAEQIVDIVQRSRLDSVRQLAAIRVSLVSLEMYRQGCSEDEIETNILRSIFADLCAAGLIPNQA